jgi:integrase
MIVDLIQICDPFRLAIFAPLALYGMRPGELGWLFREHVENGWLHVRCIPELDYFTKGRRDKGFPIVDCLRPLLSVTKNDGKGLVFVNRRVATHKAQVPLYGESLAGLVEEYRRRCSAEAKINASRRREIRNALMKDAGQLTYDHIQSQFKKLSSVLEWPAQATLKDFRHLCSSCLEDAGVPEYYRRYLMGQSFGRAPIVTYTHISQDQVKRHYMSAVDTELAPIVAAVERRSKQLGI